MNNQELSQYRVKLVRDAVDPAKKPERVPHISHFVTWKILDAGYKLSEAMCDWDIMEKVVCEFQEKYCFDALVEFGHRNNYQTSKILGSSRYYIDDENGSVNYKDFALCESDELVEYAKNPLKFKWEKGMAKKYPFWTQEFDIDILNKAYKANMDYLNFMGFNLRGRMPQKLYEDYGVPYYIDPKGYAPIAIETLFNSLRGIKGLSIDMRRNIGTLREAIAIMDESGFKPGLAALKNVPAGTKYDSTFDCDNILLAHTILNEKQWEEFYWPYLKQIIAVYGEKGWTTRLFTEGTSGRFWDYFKEFPKGVIALHLENDDVYAATEKLPGFCIMGGMTNEMLGGGTKQQCLDMTKRLIDELGANGNFILSQDKLGSYRNDAKAENLKAVCEFALEYTPSQN